MKKVKLCIGNGDFGLILSPLATFLKAPITFPQEGYVSVIATKTFGYCLFTLVRVFTHGTIFSVIYSVFYDTFQCYNFSHDVR